MGWILSIKNDPRKRRRLLTSEYIIKIYNKEGLFFDFSGCFADIKYYLVKINWTTKLIYFP